MGAAAPSVLYDHLEISEAASVGAAGGLTADGLIPIYVIRPGVGRGKGRHLYEADMLAKNAHVFKGWRMFVDHQAPEAKRALGGLPRSIRDLGGIVKEAKWDPSVPADPARGHGPGAVVAMCRPTPLIRQLVETDPELVEVSISARATGVRPRTHGGETVMVVEGFEREGSVDWVSRAGAGGRVAQLAEALEESFTAEEETVELFESMRDEDVVELVKARRPDLYERMIAEAASTADDDPERKRREAEEEHVETKDVLEALASDEGRTAIGEIVAESVGRELGTIISEQVAPKLAELVEAAMEEQHETTVAEANARADRKLVVRELAASAEKKIAESGLPESMKAELRQRFTLTEAGEPTPELDVADERDEESGEVKKTAGARVNEAVEDAIKTKREQVAEIRPTRVRGQGAAAEAKPGGEEESPAGEKQVAEAKKTTDGEKATTGSEHTDELLEAAGVTVTSDLYEGIFED